MSMRLEWETARDADPYDAWGTITLIVVSVMLSVFQFRGSDFHMLHMHHDALPQEPWRFATATVLHGGVMHLVMNIYWTLTLGVLVEALLGLSGYLVLLLGLAVAPTMSQWAISGPAVGLSGIGYGLFGVLWALDRWHPRCRGVMNRRTAEFFAAWFLVCILLSWYDIWPVANTAHAVGFLVGAGTGWALSRGGMERVTRLAVPVGITLVAYLGTIPTVRHAINRSEEYQLEVFQRGLVALEEGRNEEGRVIYQELVDRHPNFSEAWNNLSVALGRLGRFEEAARAGRRAEELGYVEEE